MEGPTCCFHTHFESQIQLLWGGTQGAREGGGAGSIQHGGCIGLSSTSAWRNSFLIGGFDKRDKGSNNT